ncbi:hypothetical protein M0811_13483 [Anaeramoeba ignava]|uniref:Uncharacterized protein n=1 Tax=Anaeramoeba ignava TaxID=1746090 RepID=A0A9Q0L5J8_ANAIG|nr:hypothetical protein M0811_13483 [Anaeramoeba ignava]
MNGFNCVVLFDENNQNKLETCAHPFLDSISQKGCSGELILYNKEQEDKNLHSVSIMSQLMATYSEFFSIQNSKPTFQIKENKLIPKDEIQTFQEKFNQMNVSLITNTNFLSLFADSLKIPCFVIDDNNLDEENISNLISKQIQNDLSNKNNLIFVHLRNNFSEEEIKSRKLDVKIERNIIILDKVAKELEKEEEKVYVIIMSGSELNSNEKSNQNSNQNSNQKSNQNLNQNSNQKKVFRPKQSYTLHDRKDISSLVEGGNKIVVSYYHNQTTRIDKVQHFNQKEIKKNGANKIIFVERFIYEMAFKMGFIEKYGA